MTLFRKVKKPLFGLRVGLQIFRSFLVLIKSLCQQKRSPNGGHDEASRLAGKTTRPEGASVPACMASGCCCEGAGEIGWGLGPFTGVLAPEQTP